MLFVVFSPRVPQHNLQSISGWNIFDINKNTIGASAVRTMKTPIVRIISPFALLSAVLLTAITEVSAADSPATLKDAYKNYFYVGVAINRTIATGTAVRADNVNRTMDRVEKDTALTKEQFNQISPENDLKWQLIQPREGPNGYDFGPADAYVNFGVANNMYIVGHTLVWHGQTPGWVFAGTNLPPGATNAPAPVAANTETNAPRRRGSGCSSASATRSTPASTTSSCSATPAASPSSSSSRATWCPACCTAASGRG